MDIDEARRKGEDLAKYTLLVVGLSLLTLGTNWKVAAGFYCLFAWALERRRDA